MSPYLIAMTGGSGSGKSTVADALLERCGHLGVTVFAEDGYYWPMSHYGPAETEAQREAIDRFAAERGAEGLARFD